MYKIIPPRESGVNIFVTKRAEKKSRMTFSQSLLIVPRLYPSQEKRCNNRHHAAYYRAGNEAVCGNQRIKLGFKPLKANIAVVQPLIYLSAVVCARLTRYVFHIFSPPLPIVFLQDILQTPSLPQFVPSRSFPQAQLPHRRYTAFRRVYSICPHPSAH